MSNQKEQTIRTTKRSYNQAARAASRRAFIERGGKLLQVELEADHLEQLELLRDSRGHSTIKETVVALLNESRYVVDFHVKLTKAEADALVKVRERKNLSSNRAAVAFALLKCAGE